MSNELPLGARRTGDLFAFDPDTPPVRVSLKRSEAGISVEVPWSSFDDDYASWFMRGAFQGLPAVDKPIPKRLGFADSRGALQLVHCWPWGFHSNFAFGTGRMWANFAVMGVDQDIDFTRIDGIESEVSGLREWLGVSSVHEQDSRSLPDTITVVGKPADEIVVTPDLTFVPTWFVERPPGSDAIVLRDSVACRTRSTTSADWDDLTRTHRGVRDLLVLARWRREVLTVKRVTRADDPMLTLDGEEHGRQWRDVVVARHEEPPAFVSGYRPFVMEHDEIGGSDGVARWLNLRDEFSRALDPIISDRYLGKVPALTHLAQVGPGLKALGYLLRLRDGVSKRKAGNTSLRERLNRIAADVDGAVPFDASTWAEETTSAYNGIKHANRGLPEELDLMNRSRECVVVVRAWVAHELGVEPAAVKRRLELDPSAARSRART